MKRVKNSSFTNVETKGYRKGIVMDDVQNSTFRNIRTEGLKIAEKLHVPYELVIGVISAVIGAGLWELLKYLFQLLVTHH